MSTESDLVTFSLSLLAALVLLLTFLEAQRYATSRSRPHLFWSAGLLLVVVTLVMEVYFYAGFWSQALIRSYLFLVAVLVGLLSLGSADLALGRAPKRLFAGYIVAAIALAGWVILQAPQSPSIVTSGVVTGFPGIPVTVVSSLVTGPAAVLMAAGSISSAYHQRKWRPALTAAGIIVISIAGALYIASIPVTLYYAEFLGVVLLFAGFGGIPSSLARASSSRLAAGGGN